MSTVPTVLRKGTFCNKVAIVTGGGTGIGFAISSELAYLGCTVIIGSRKMENLKIASKKINDMIQSLNMNNKCIPLQLNIRDSSSIKEFTQALVNDHHISNIDYVVNNAGGQFPSKLEDISENGWKAVIDLNLNGTFLFSNHIFNTFWKKSAKNIIEKNQRVIINTVKSYVNSTVLSLV
eukprot:511674_1